MPMVGEMPTRDPLISACMIVRNEEHFLEGCLRSIKGVVDEIVIGDTGSTDRTPDIAYDFGARLYSIPWNDDFSNARNQVLEKAKGVWILSIDADERLRPIPRLRLKRSLKSPSHSAYHVLMHPMSGWTGSRVIRLFRNDPRIRFKGIFHETLWNRLQSVISNENTKIGCSDLILDHLGYDDDQKEKHLRNLPFLLKEIERDPERSHVWSHLGLVYEALGDDDLAKSAWNRAIELAKNKEDGYIYGYLYYMGWKARHGQPIGGLLEEAMRYSPENPYLYWLKGRALIDENRYHEAVPFFERLVLWGEKRDFNRLSMSYPTHIFDINAFDSLAVCHFRLENYAESRRYFQLAEELAPEKLEYKTKRRLCESFI
jgi:glycosyltransferase involved in cell wall biosynthesis